MSARNFKSFASLTMVPRGFNVLIGPNASGKSNIISMIGFMRDLSARGLRNAISLQGGEEYLRNLRIGMTAPTAVEFVIDASSCPVNLVFCNGGNLRVEAACTTFDYGLRLEFPEAGNGCRITAEWLRATCRYRGFGEGAGTGDLGDGTIEIRREDDRLVCTVLPGAVGSTILLPSVGEPVSPYCSLLENPTTFPLLSPMVYGVADFFRGVALYDFDPKLSKKATTITGRRELEPDGRNLALVLREILDDPTRRHRFTTLLGELIPFVEDLRVERLADRTLYTTFVESYQREKAIPAPLVSDGTINVTALLISLYFGERDVMIFEEPERNLHPYLISKIIDMMQEVPARLDRQLFITTHNPEFVKYAGMDHLFLVQRDESGFSTVTRPSEKEDVALFLENMGIEELYVQNLL
jgi:predicted ATPase